MFCFPAQQAPSQKRSPIKEKEQILSFNSFPPSGNFCHLLITFANSLDPDQARQQVGPDLDPNCLTL